MDVTWHKTDLRLWLSLETWTSEQAIDVLSGFNPKGRENLELLKPESEITKLFIWEQIRDDDTWDWDWNSIDPAVIEIVNNALELKKTFSLIWDSTEASYDEFDNKMNSFPYFQPPKFYFDLLVKGGFEPPWLDWAIDEGLFSDELKINKIKTPNFPDDKYPALLDTAILAYQRAIEDDSPGITPKQKIEKYLKKHHKDLSGESIKQISTIANWHKRGGAPKKIK